MYYFAWKRQIMLQETASTKLMVAKAGIKCTLCLLHSFCLSPSATKIYLIQNLSSKEGEKVDLVPCYNTFAGQGRNIHGIFGLNHNNTAVGWIATNEMQSWVIFQLGACIYAANIAGIHSQHRHLGLRVFIMTDSLRTTLRLEGSHYWD